ncbi:MAG: two-component sensor histidine kinase [Rhodobiaceae bacterium]|nr:two-component sensor histidine kinase [Rhodobiaceae bacterium]
MNKSEGRGPGNVPTPASDRHQPSVAPDVAPGIVYAAMEQLPDAVVLLGANGHILFCNRSAESFLGPRAKGKHISSMLRESAVLEALERIQQGGAAERVEFKRPFPVEHHYQASLSTVKATDFGGDADGGTTTLLVLHDISDAKRVEQMRVDFVANASHELRTPLASLLGFIETLQGPAKDDEEARERFLAIMGEQAARMQALIEDLLSLSHIELREHQPPTETISLQGLAHDVVDVIAPIAARNNVEIKVDIPADLPSVKGDWDELHQVVQNLVDNAIKYGQEGERVEISGRVMTDGAGGQRVELAVRDFGPGIAREYIPRLTERFYRIDVATSRARGGTGLGLAIVKHILNRHGAELVIDSTLGEGATFAIRFPIGA